VQSSEALKSIKNFRSECLYCTCQKYSEILSCSRLHQSAWRTCTSKCSRILIL